MHCFAIIGASDSNELENAILERFPEHNHRIAENAWIVATEEKLPFVVSDMVGFSPKTGAVGVVVKCDDYNGYFERALWEKMSAWQWGA